MGKLIFGMMQSLDGYIEGSDGALPPPPGPIVFRHFTEAVRNADGLLYGRRLYEIMRYWEEDRPDWDDVEREFAEAWRPQQKWVATRSTTPLGPNATLVQGSVTDFAATLKTEHAGEIHVSGTELAQTLSAAGLIDEYRLYFRPFVLGGGKPFFAGSPPPLRLLKAESIGEDVARLIYVPA